MVRWIATTSWSSRPPSRSPASGLLVEYPPPFHAIAPPVLLDDAESRFHEIKVRVPPLEPDQFRRPAQRHGPGVQVPAVHRVALFPPVEPLVKAQAAVGGDRVHDRMDPRRYTRTAATTDSPRASPESSSPHAVTLVLTDEERGPESASEDRTTDGTSVMCSRRGM